MMKFPYGQSDFGKLMRDGYFYQDRSDRIPLLEAAGDQLLFIRPRRFGKSLLLSMLEHYYDLRRADEFEHLFGHLAIGRAPTPLRNRYFVMKWDFSLIQSQGEVREIETAIHQHLNDCIRVFARDYADRLPFEIEIHPDNALSSWRSALSAVSRTANKLYLLIDEYDNFANEVLMAGRRRDSYEALLHGEGLLKTVFKAVKAGAGGMGLDRVFITGVSPVVMSDMTSGYNVAENIYLAPRFNDLCGFTEAEIAGLLATMGTELNTDLGTDLGAGPDSSDRPGGAAALETMRTFYNGYCFSTKAPEPIYNPTLVLYFCKALASTGEYPEPLLDDNMAMDRDKLAYIAALPHGEELLVRALESEQGVEIPQLATRFGVAEVLSAVKDAPFMASLLYYFGILTLGGRGMLGKTKLGIPNLVVRGLYIERLRACWFTQYDERETQRLAAEACYLRGDLAPLVAFIETRFFPILSNRDYRWTNELAVKIAFLTLLFDDRLYLPLSEAEVDHGYIDLALIVRPDMRRFQALDLLLEFKYLSLKELGLSGEQLRALSPEELSTRPAVVAALDAAAAQAHRYGQALYQRYRLHDLRRFAVVGIGLERVLWRETTAPRAGTAAEAAPS